MSEPVFAEPWQAQAFAMAVELSRRGYFTWQEWTDALAAEIAGADAGYYQHWLRALEALVLRKGLFSESDLAERRHAWERAARETEHGKPIVLRKEEGR